MLRNEVSRGDVRRELLSCVMLEMVAKLGYCIVCLCDYDFLDVVAKLLRKIFLCFKICSP